MSRLKVPLVSLKAWGTLARELTFRRHKRAVDALRTPYPKDAMTALQLAQRLLFQEAVAWWHSLTETEKQAYDKPGRDHHMSGYAWFIRSYLLNPPAATFLALTDTPAAYTDEAGKSAQVNAAEDALQFGYPYQILDSDGDSHVRLQHSHGEDYLSATLNSLSALQGIQGGILNFPYQSAAWAYLTSAQSIPASTETKLQFDAESFDVQNEFDSTTNYRFTASQPGRYAVVVRAAIIGIANGKRIATRIYVNGASKTSSPLMYNNTGAAANVTAVAVSILNLSAADYIEGYIYQNDTVARDTGSGENYDFIIIAKIA